MPVLGESECEQLVKMVLKKGFMGSGGLFSRSEVEVFVLEGVEKKSHLLTVVSSAYLGDSLHVRFKSRKNTAISKPSDMFFPVSACFFDG